MSNTHICGLLMYNFKKQGDILHNENYQRLD